MTRKTSRTVNVSDSINSGQVFLWDKDESSKGWTGIHGDRVLHIDDGFEPDSCDNDVLRSFFRLDDDYDRIIRDISKDGVIRHAVKRYKGLRVLRQEPFQCYISFIVSSNSNIQNIRAGLQRICRTFGKGVSSRGVRHHLFPKPKALARASVGELLGCGLGYRAKFVKEAAGLVADGRISLEALAAADYDTAKSELSEVSGVGDKVADCIMLFSLEKLEAFPLDVWSTRALEMFYPDGLFSTNVKSMTPKRYRVLHSSVIDHFGPYAGVAQQFLFKMARDGGPNKRWLD